MAFIVQSKFNLLLKTSFDPEDSSASSSNR